MTPEIQIRAVTVEMLRPGPAHNQLLSPLTQYLGICDDAEAGIVTQPYEHAAFLRRMASMRYDKEGWQTDRLPVLREMGIEMAKVLGSIPRLAGSLTADQAGPDTLVHLRLVLSASELAALPFELAKVPIGPSTCSESWLSLQARLPVVITRRTRNVSAAGVAWPMQPRILFVAAHPDDVPFAEHRDALIEAVAPFLPPGSSTLSEDGRREAFGELLTIWKDARFEDVLEECERVRYTHIHILAHGKAEAAGETTSFGLELHAAQISAERLASALTCIVDGATQRPSVVTLATCDSGNVGSVMVPGASIAHVLHQAGIPLVVASQVPLSMEGSKLVVREFYRGQLWGENPWVLLHRIRTGLHGLLSARSHDWASLVVYEALPLDLTPSLEEARYRQCIAAIKVALKAVVVADAALPEYAERKQAVFRLFDRLPLGGAYEMECLGQRASAMKQLAEVEFNIAHRAGANGHEARDAHVRQSCLYLDRALHDYEQAVEGFLVNPLGKAVQRVATLHWVLVQQLCLSAVLCKDVPDGAMQAAIMSATAYLEHPDPEQQAWAHGSLAELWLLKVEQVGRPPLQEPALTLEAIRREVRSHLKELVRLARRLDRKFIIDSTLKQFKRYVDWWGDPLFEQTVIALDFDDRYSGEAGPVMAEGGTSAWQQMGLVRIAADMVEMMADRDAAARGAPGPLTPAAVASSAPVTAGSVNPANANTTATVIATATATADSTSPDGENLLGASRPPRPATAPSQGRDTGPFIHIEMLAAGHGDCMWMEYGEGDKLSRVLIDCGTDSTYSKVLKPRILQQKESARHFELFILTHIDDDHIGGGISLLNEAQSLGATFGDVWFNGWKHIKSFGGFLGSEQGEKFSQLIRQNKLKWNDWLHEAPIVLPDTGALPTCTLPGGMLLTLLSPTGAKLGVLADKWKKDIDKLGKTPGEDEFLGDKAPRSTDSTDVNELANAEFVSDTAPNNGSSIAVLADYKGKRVLLGADAHAPLLVEAISRLVKAGTKLKLDAFKLPHHGSQNNLNKELMAVLECKNYLVSSDGSTFRHPDRQAIARVIQGGGHQPRLHFNYESKFNAVWKAPELQRKHGYDAVYPEPGAQGLMLRL